jgi:hypothetical protein
MRDTRSAGVFKVAAPSRPRFARIAAFDRILRLSQAPTQLPQPRSDHAPRAAPNALVRAAVAKAQARNNDNNFGQTDQR